VVAAPPGFRLTGVRSDTSRCHRRSAEQVFAGTDEQVDLLAAVRGDFKLQQVETLT
jgi:hypothetical protein